MSLNDSPGIAFAYPTPTQGGVGYWNDYWWDKDATRYRVLAIEIDDEFLVCAEPDQGFGRTWAVFRADGGYLSDDYIAEKLRLRVGDTESLARLVRLATGRTEE